jgi:hypothetical protein
MKYEPDKDELALILAQWKREHGVVVYSKRYGTPYDTLPKNPVARREMFLILIDTLAGEPFGFEQKDFGYLIKERIVESCVYSDYEDQSALKKWRNNLHKDFVQALAVAFPGNFQLVKRESVVENVEFMSPEEESKLKNPVDREKLKRTGIATPVVIPDLDFLASLEATDE